MKVAKNKVSEKQLYNLKLKRLRAQFEEIKPLDFYRELFPEGSFEKCGVRTGKPNGVLIQIDEAGRGRQRLIFDDLKTLKEYQGLPNVIMSPIGYFGKRRISRNASKLYAMVFDLDGQGMDQLGDTIHQMYKVCIIPPATYIALSGHGVHLYYVFPEPLDMKPFIQRELNKLKEWMTQRVWNPFTSTIEKRQYQPITQGFRIVGSLSKMGKRYPVRIFKTGKRISIPEIVKLIPKNKEYDKYRINIEVDTERVPIEKAKQMWPKWYQNRILNGYKPGIWSIKRALYDWWLDKIKDAEVGHRYFCIMTLAMYAYKCGVSQTELKRDAYAQIPAFDAISDSKDNRFTEKDVRAALEAYRPGAQNYTRDLISKLSGFLLLPNKRNYRKQSEHLQIARAIEEVVFKNKGVDWRVGNGRPHGSLDKKKKKGLIVQDWQKENPNGRKVDCNRDTGLDPKTIRKWWNVDVRQLIENEQKIEWESQKLSSLTFK